MTHMTAPSAAARLGARPRRLLVLAVGLTVVLTGAPWPNGRAPALDAQTGPSVRIEFQRDTVQVGEQFDVFAHVQGADDLAGFDLSLGFDEASLSFVAAEIGTAFLESGGRTAVPLGPNVLPNRIELGAVTLPGSGQGGANGAGDLALFTFRALAVGEATLTLSGIRLVDTAGTQFEPEGQDAAIVVTSPVTATPPAPTAAPMRPGAYLPWLARGRN